MKRVILLCVSVCLIMGLFAGCCLKHEWENATCEAPKTCAKCGKTAGKTLDHEYVLRGCEAQGDTIYELHICKVCGDIDKIITEDEVALANTLILGRWNVYDPEGVLGGMEAWIEFSEDKTGELYHAETSEKFTWFSYAEKANGSISESGTGITMVIYGMEESLLSLAIFCEPDGNTMLYMASGGGMIPFSR